MLVFHHQIKETAQDGGAFFAGPFRPFLLRGLGGGNGTGHLRTAKIRHMRDDVPARGVRDPEGAIIAIHPLAIDIGPLAQQAGVLEHGFQVGLGHCVSLLAWLLSRHDRPAWARNV